MYHRGLRQDDSNRHPSHADRRRELSPEEIRTENRPGSSTTSGTIRGGAKGPGLVTAGPPGRPARFDARGSPTEDGLVHHRDRDAGDRPGRP